MGKQRPHIVVPQHVAEVANLDGFVVVGAHTARKEERGRLASAGQRRQQLQAPSQITYFPFDEIGGQFGHAVAEAFYGAKVGPPALAQRQAQVLDDDAAGRRNMAHDARRPFDHKLPPAGCQRRRGEMGTVAKDGRIGCAAADIDVGHLGVVPGGIVRRPGPAAGDLRLDSRPRHADDKVACQV